jgi:hypothetical protein
MIDHLVRDLHVLRKADFLIGKIWLTVLVRRAGLFAFAGLIGVFGLGMTNVAGYNGLQQSIGAVWAATAMAMLDFAIAAIVLLVAAKSGPGSEIDTALEVRRMAIDSIQENTLDLKLTLNSLGEEMKGLKETVTRLMHNPLDVASEKLLVPAALSMLRGLRLKKDGA